MNRCFRFSLTELLTCLCLGHFTSYSYAESAVDIKPENLNSLVIICIFILLILSGVFLICIRKLILDRNKLKENYQRLCSNNDELLSQKHHWLDTETEMLNTNMELEKRITARTETVNKVNHELTRALEKLHQQDTRLNSLTTALESCNTKILIIDKHYRVCFASKSFLKFTGLYLIDIKDQPLKLLEKHICLPEMASNGLTLNKDGLIYTQLKCLDNNGLTHWLNAQIALSWSDLKEIIHYVIIFQDNEDACV